MQEVLDDANSGTVRGAIRALIDEIRLMPDKADPKAPLAIELRGDLAAILAFASGTKPEAADALALQLRVVVGPATNLNC